MQVVTDLTSLCQLGWGLNKLTQTKCLEEGAETVSVGQMSPIIILCHRRTFRVLVPPLRPRPSIYNEGDKAASNQRIMFRIHLAHLTRLRALKGLWRTGTGKRWWGVLIRGAWRLATCRRQPLRCWKASRVQVLGASDLSFDACWALGFGSGCSWKSKFCMRVGWWLAVWVHCLWKAAQYLAEWDRTFLSWFSGDIMGTAKLVRCLKLKRRRNWVNTQNAKERYLGLEEECVSDWTTLREKRVNNIQLRTLQMKGIRICSPKYAAPAWGLLWAEGDLEMADAGGILCPPHFCLKAGRAFRFAKVIHVICKSVSWSHIKK